MMNSKIKYNIYFLPPAFAAAGVAVAAAGAAFPAGAAGILRILFASMLTTLP